MDAYIHVRTRPGTARQVAREIGGLEVRSVATITGDWDLVVSLENVGPERLGETVIDRIGSIDGVMQTSTAVVLDVGVVGFNGPKPPMPTRGITEDDVEVLVLVGIQIEAGSALRVIEELAGFDALQGLCLLTGDVDVLVELKAASWDRMSEILVGDVQALSGVVSTNTSLIVGAKVFGSQAEQAE
jgi:DNA-binding Lrp family transcriptional regulator